MSMQIKLIPIYLEDESLISIDEESYKNNLESYNLEDEVDSDEFLQEYMELQKNDKFGEETIVPTPIKDKKLIIKALSKFTQKFRNQEKLLDFIDTGSLTVKKSVKGTYNLCFQGYFRDYEIKEISDEIINECKLDLQEITYEKVLSKIREKNLNIESENITTDDSIVLTLTI